MDGQNFNNGYNQPQQQQQPYGQPQQPYGQPYGAPYGQPGMPQPDKASGLSLAGLIIGIVAIVSACILSWISSFIGLVGLILSIIGQVKNKTKLGLAAIIVSAAGIVVGIIFFVVYAYILVSTDLLSYY